MIEPVGPKPNPDRRPESQEPRFEQAGTSDDQPMYATEPDAPGLDPQEGAVPPDAVPHARPAAGGWDVPGAGQADKAAQPEHGSQAELTAALAAAEARANENHERHLRALAEMENVRRRAHEDVSKAHKFAIESFAESLLPVRDSLEMALAVDVPSMESMKEGVEATLRQLTQAFERHRLLVIDPLHQKFDPNRHQAILMAPSREVAPNHVVSVLQKGYMINDRVLRPALVTVSKPA